LEVTLVGEGEGADSEDGVAVDEIREVGVPDDIGVDNGGVEAEGGVSRLEGIGIDEVSDGMGELNEPDMLLMVKKDEYC
jgi:hypothetical protein